ncbi:hypothetical protein ACIRD3_07525 [Kitasatospora sp. NPDC093550]|uniref:hypothetical protein n=1 Tax=Kitasatospora sp. NPDC093550 TaxID=3364089 RepID=UPI0037F522EC
MPESYDIRSIARALELPDARKDLHGLAPDLLRGERPAASVPDGSTFALLLEHGGRRPPLTDDGHGARPTELVLTHRSRTTEPWADPARRRVRRCTAVHPATAAAGTTVEV